MSTGKCFGRLTIDDLVVTGESLCSFELCK